MDIQIFNSSYQEDSETQYRNWLANNYAGFVVNFRKDTKGNGTVTDFRFTRIHRTSCKTINPLCSEKDKTGFTTGDYQKICAANLEQAEAEAIKLTSLSNIKFCCKCK